MPGDHFRLPPLRTSTEQAPQRKLGHIFSIPPRRPRPEETSQDQESEVEESESEASENEDLEGLKTMMASAQEQFHKTMERLASTRRPKRKFNGSRIKPHSLSEEAMKARRKEQLRRNGRLYYARQKAKKEAQAQENLQREYPTTPSAAVPNPPHTPSPLWKAEYQPSPSMPSQEKPRPDVEPLSPRKEDSVMRVLEEP